MPLRLICFDLAGVRCVDGLYPWARRPSYTSLIALEYLLYSLHPQTLHYAERPKFQDHTNLGNQMARPHAKNKTID